VTAACERARLGATNGNGDDEEVTVRFTAPIERTGATTTGIRVPDEIIERLGQGKRPRVVAVLDGGYALRTTVGTHDGSPFLSVSSAVRREAGVEAGDEVTVDLTVDDAPREVEVPDDLAAALADADDARAWFEGLTASQRSTFTTSVTSAKQPETRQRRVAKAVAALAAHEKRP
jgi:Pyruvate/2-oxoacid:ferredoxin oxidoreductase gamma subunit